MTPRSLILVLTYTAGLTVAVPSAAQPLGTFRWQLSPFCNVITLDVTQLGAQYRLEGFDDACGAPTRAAVTGLVVPNLDGTLEFGLTVVSPAGPQHIDVTFSIASLGGPWRDNGGNTGTLVFNPASVSGPSRPAGIGAIAINPAQVQMRVTGSCGAGQSVKSINADGTVGCAAAGTISSVSAGPGLLGGGTTGSVQLYVDFAGDGIQGTVAHGDHAHNRGGGISGNTAIGNFAMPGLTNGGGNTAAGTWALENLSDQSSNTAVGSEALSDVDGSENTAVGASALARNTSSFNTAIGSKAMYTAGNANRNVAVGESALRGIVTGNHNVAVGQEAMRGMGDGAYNVAIGAEALETASKNFSNVAVGHSALGSLTGSFSDNNIAIGRGAGINLLNGSGNIYVGHDGLDNDNGQIRIGTAGTHTGFFVAGVAGVAPANATQVYINPNNGRLGSVNSSARFKERIAPIDNARSIVQSLEPVTFFYKPEYDSDARERQFGLIAEDVEKVSRDLVVYDTAGRPQTVRYHFLTPFLIAEVQRLERERDALERRLSTQEREIAELRALIERR